MPKVPNERGPDEKPDPKPTRRPDEGGIRKGDTGGLVRPPSEPGAKPHVQDEPMERPGTEAEESKSCDGGDKGRQRTTTAASPKQNTLPSDDDRR